MPSIESSSYGESRLRMLRVFRHGDRHDPRDLTIAVRFEGRFEPAFRGEAAAALLPGEAVKNLVHRVVAREDHDTIEALGLSVCEAILAEHRSIGLARVDISEQPWRRLVAGGKPQAQAFTPAGLERRTAAVSGNGARVSVSAGVENMIVLRSGGFLPAGGAAAADDAAPEGLSRLFVAALSATWAYTSREIAFGPYRQGVLAAIVGTFASNTVKSVQELLYAIADVVLATYQEIATVTLSLQERPYHPADLLELSVGGDSLFVAHDEPVGVVEITVARS